MSDKSIIVENISKRYRIGLLERKSDTLAGTLFNYIKYPINNFKRLRSLTNFNINEDNGDSTIWALKDINFDVKEGEVLGIIGKNGAGKSTLLKILSRITLPTSGKAELKGRVSSLLEVGTGFHPELTGRENVYLNGTILGMSKKEIDSKFDEIVDFSGIEKFIDTPVKRYSSGMGVRLAFSVGANLNSEIMIIDEVLAVGDVSFQRKCLGKIGNISNEGKTVLFVSHNMIAIQNLCNRTVWLDKGKIVEQGDTIELVTKYLTSSQSKLNFRQWDGLNDSPGNEIIRIKSASVKSDYDENTGFIKNTDPIKVDFKYWVLIPDNILHTLLVLKNELGIHVFSSAPKTDKKWFGKSLPNGLYSSSCYIPANLLNEGNYSIDLMLVKDMSKVIYKFETILNFDIIEDTSDRIGDWHGKHGGVIRPLLNWNISYHKDHIEQTNNCVNKKP